MDRVADTAANELHTLLGVWTWDVRTNLVVACQDVCEYMNIPSDVGIHGVSAERFLEAVDHSDRSELERRISDMLAGSDVLLAEYRVLSIRHGACWVRLSAHCFRDQSGQPTHVSGYLTRISEPEPPETDDQKLHVTIMELLIQAREASAKLSNPTLNKLITAVLLEASFQLANILKRS